jgi:hypothetical protein
VIWKGRKVSKKRYFDLSREKKRNDEVWQLERALWVDRATYRRLAEILKEDSNGGN